MTQNTVSKTALPTLISLFFIWGFVASSIDIMIPFFKEKLSLEQWQSQLIAFGFYIAYTVGSIIYYLISRQMGQDLLNKIGYRNGISLGLAIAATGTLLFYPAAQAVSFPLMISGYFILGLGFSLMQTAANPLTIVLGDPKKGNQRLSLAGGINNIGSLLGPLLVSIAIFGTVNSTTSGQGLEGLKTPFLVIGVVFIILAIGLKLSSIPNQINLNLPVENNAPEIKDRKSVFNYPQLWLGMIAIFVYVGVEVSTAANLPLYMKQHLNITTEGSAPYVALYWGSLLIGRWTASVEVLARSSSLKSIMRLVMPYLAFGFFLLVNYLAGHDLQPFYKYSYVILVLIIANMLSKGNPVRQLLIFSAMGIVALFIGMMTEGMLSVYAFISVGLFCSTLWPCIFTLAIAGLGKHTNEGSGFLIMMIMGGGIISVLQGFLAKDIYLGIQWSYLAGVVCFAYLAFYALRAKTILRKQGIDYDVAAVSH